MTPEQTPTVIVIERAWSREEIIDALQKPAANSSVIIVIDPQGIDLPRDVLIDALQKIRQASPQQSCILASKNREARRIAKAAGWNTIDRVRALRTHTEGHPLHDDALRTFSPRLWQNAIRSQLQTLGLLALPRLRIWILCGASIIVFGFVFFRLLPSATVEVWPSEDTVTQTVNVYLVSSGAVNIPVDRVRTLPLVPLTVSHEQTLTFDEISKDFKGTSAELAMTVHNDSDEVFSLRKGTRFTNQAGMVFRLQESVIIDPKSEVTAKSLADDIDLFGEIIGERGNVPAGLKWDIPGLLPEQQLLVYGRNEEVGVGGTTSYETVVTQEDLDLARKKLENELLITARQLIDEQRELRSANKDISLRELRYDDLTRIAFRDFSVPSQYIGQKISSFPVTGTIDYTVLLYDENALFEMLYGELDGIVSADKTMVEGSITKENLVLYVIDAPWDAPTLDWVKLTVDLSGSQRYELTPLSPTGAKFGKQVRELIAGKSVEEAESIIKNMQEVDSVDISVWPPWSHTLPPIGSNIVIKQGI